MATALKDLRISVEGSTTSATVAIPSTTAPKALEKPTPQSKGSSSSITRSFAKRRTSLPQSTRSPKRYGTMGIVAFDSLSYNGVFELVKIFFKNLFFTSFFFLISGCGDFETIFSENNDDINSSILSVSDISIKEGDAGNTQAQVTVTLSHFVQPVSVNYHTEDGSATIADNDYINTSGTLHFMDSDVSKIITIPVIGDIEIEGNETLEIVLSNPQNAILSSKYKSKITIIDDESRVVLSDINFQDNNLRQCVLDTGFTYADELISLNCSLKNIQFSDGIEELIYLEQLDLSRNQIGSIDIRNNVALTNVNLHLNKITELDLSNNINLVYLDISENQLINVDISNNAILESFYAYSNSLSTLDISNNIHLKSIGVAGNQIRNMDVSNNTALTNLNIEGNEISSLDISNIVLLQSIYASDNQLTSIDVSNNTNLYDLVINRNALSSLNLSNNTELTNLSVHDNDITSIDVSNNTKLFSLNIDNNALRS